MYDLENYPYHFVIKNKLHYYKQYFFKFPNNDVLLKNDLKNYILFLMSLESDCITYLNDNNIDCVSKIYTNNIGIYFKNKEDLVQFKLSVVL